MMWTLSEGSCISGMDFSQQKQEVGDPSISVELLNRDLWKKFYMHTNEMIINKRGRRLFPIVDIRLRGLEPRSVYALQLEFVQSGKSRMKFKEGVWSSYHTQERSIGVARYRHSDSPNYGSHWMNSDISFSKLKVTNTIDEKNSVALSSLYKYYVKITVLKMDNSNNTERIIHSCSFPVTEFVAVTAYQNAEVTQLKIRHNPHARSFQEQGSSRQSLLTERTSSDRDSIESNPGRDHHQQQLPNAASPDGIPGMLPSVLQPQAVTMSPDISNPSRLVPSFEESNYSFNREQRNLSIRTTPTPFDMRLLENSVQTCYSQTNNYAGLTPPSSWPSCNHVSPSVYDPVPSVSNNMYRNTACASQTPPYPSNSTPFVGSGAAPQGYQPAAVPPPSNSEHFSSYSLFQLTQPSFTSSLPTPGSSPANRNRTQGLPTFNDGDFINCVGSLSLPDKALWSAQSNTRLLYQMQQ